jgi:hypothetical protein
MSITFSKSASREDDHTPPLTSLPDFSTPTWITGRMKSALSATLGFILLGAVLLVLFLVAMASASRPAQGVYEPSNRIECVRSPCLPA